MKKLTLTIGIPAHNEELNIGALLSSILKQEHRNFTLRKVYVYCDGCEDNTARVVKTFTKKSKKIIVVNDRKRHGKAYRLNQIYRKTTTDLLLTLDADLVLEGNLEIEKMVDAISKNEAINVVGARFIPVPQKTFWGKISVLSYQSFEDAALKLKNGNNFYTLVGGASLLKASFAHSFKYPYGVVSDQNYLYAMAIRDGKNGYKLAKSAHVLMRTVGTFHDWRVLGVRSTTTDKENVMSFFGKDIMADYTMPKHLFAKSLLKFFFKHPILTTGSIVMNIYIRLFPYMEYTPANGMWEMTVSSKLGMM